MSETRKDEAKTIVAGALFDFLGYLTSRDGVIRCGAAESPTEALGAMMEWFKSRGLDPHNADVNGWTSALARATAEGVTAEPVAWCPRLADGRLQIEHASASLDEVQEDVRMLNVVPTASTDLPWQPVIIQPLYARATPPAAETGNAGLTHSGPCKACGQTIPATPPTSAGTPK